MKFTSALVCFLLLLAAGCGGSSDEPEASDAEVASVGAAALCGQWIVLYVETFGEGNAQRSREEGRQRLDDLAAGAQTVAELDPELQPLDDAMSDVIEGLDAADVDLLERGLRGMNDECEKHLPSE